jgi:hypothetical protein
MQILIDVCVKRCMVLERDTSASAIVDEASHHR